MKKLIILVVLAIQGFQVTLKASPFGTSQSEYITYPPSNLTTTTLRVAVYVINRNDGSGGLTSQQVTDAINHLKQDFAPTNIFFIIVEISAINDDNCFKKKVPVSWYALYNRGHKDDAINVYLGPMGVENGVIYAGETWYSPGNFLFVHGDYTTTAALAHEMGHCLGLFHTHYGRGQDAGRVCEEAIDGSNCESCGDLCLDSLGNGKLFDIFKGENFQSI
ncbi:MAG TPA: hypothetical protein P5268_00005 [Candidatus Marinimicrobia bacterium]|nr:hypothetical protein [Candidatus Neomarinimicrobiota bacterium]HRS51360.1 hypothetical protein [Candidatus Neomarinimicrobiota bacterium]HRU91402.1 hypothetical protein [Candidatus Neomarinimicrobiota bacterium]